LQHLYQNRAVTSVVQEVPPSFIIFQGKLSKTPLKNARPGRLHRSG